LETKLISLKTIALLMNPDIQEGHGEDYSFLRYNISLLIISLNKLILGPGLEPYNYILGFLLSINYSFKVLNKVKF
jgi:hypothetical protein